MTVDAPLDGYPDLEQVRLDCKAAKKALRSAGFPAKLITSIETKALKTGRKVTGEHRTNRDPRWKLSPGHPQYASERDSRVIFLILSAMVFEFENAPPLTETSRLLLEPYLGKVIACGIFKDSLLLEKLDYYKLRDDSLTPKHGHGIYHIGHQDPTKSPRHVPENVAWRTSRSNLIQGDMTLRQARIYLVKLIGRYFELGELDIT